MPRHQSFANPPAPLAAAPTIHPTREYAPPEKSAAHTTPSVPRSSESAPDHLPSPTGTAPRSKSSSPYPNSLSRLPLSSNHVRLPYFRGDFRSTVMVSP